MPCIGRTLARGLLTPDHPREGRLRLSNKSEQQCSERGIPAIPLLMYSAVPFLPSFLLSSLNDDYLLLKQRFDAASAALPPSISRDSLEYIAASVSYNDAMRQLFVLLLSKRLALYFLATCAAAYAGWRASGDVTAIRDGTVSGPGGALDRLNREILEGEDVRGRPAAPARDGDERDEEDDLFAILVDDNPESDKIGDAVALALPVALAGALGASYLALTLAGGTSPGADDVSSLSLPESLTSSLPYLTSLPTAFLCLFFAATEFRWALPNGGAGHEGGRQSLPPDPTRTTDDGSSSPTNLLSAGNVLALAYVIGAYYAKIHPTLSLNESTMLDLWPLQNGVNICLSTTVARALSPFLIPASPSSKSIRTVALALVGLALFDAVFTFGTVANAAAAAEPSLSVMETVARAKLASSSPSSDAVVSPLAYLWQPGLLEIILGHDNSQATEALGLGDIVFPGLLVAWSFVADGDDGAMSSAPGGGSATNDDGTLAASPGRQKGYPYATASVAGYVLGSLATEIVGSFSLLGNVSGLPALVFLVPSMLGAVTMVAWSRNELQDVWGTAMAGDDNESGGIDDSGK